VKRVAKESATPRKRRTRKKTENDPIAELWAAYARQHDDLSLRNRLVEHYLPLADRAARAFVATVPTFVDTDGILSTVRQALLRVVEMFEPARGLKFETYAFQRLRGAAIDELRATDAVSRGPRARRRTRQAGIARLTQQLCRRPTSQEIEDELGIEPPRDSVAQTISLNTTIYEGEPGDKAICLESLLRDRPRDAGRFCFARLVRGLDMDAKTMLWLRFAKGQPMWKIGEAMALSESRVSQLISASLAELRRQGRKEIVEDF